MTKLTTIEGIGARYAEKLETAGLKNQKDLLEKAGQTKGRKEIAKTTGISEKLLLGWANRADLARIKGVGEEFADLLECSGVDTVPELAQRNAVNLHKKIKEINEVKKLTRALPSEKAVTGWIEQAKTLPKAVFH